MSFSPSLLNPEAPRFIPSGQVHASLKTLQLLGLPREIRDLICTEIWLSLRSVNLGGMRYRFSVTASNEAQFAALLEPGVMEPQIRSLPNAAANTLWFASCKQIHVEATEQARRMATVIFDPRFALGGWARRPRSDRAQPLRLQYDVSFLNPWLCRCLRISDIIHTREFEGAHNSCTVRIDPQSCSELAILQTPPADAAAKIQILELRIRVEVLPTKRFDHYHYDFSSLELLGVPSLQEVRISMELVDSSFCDPSRHLRAHLSWSGEYKNEWRERIKEETMEEVKRLARSMLGGQQQVQEEIISHVYEADEFGQPSRLLVLKRNNEAQL